MIRAALPLIVAALAAATPARAAITTFAGRSAFDRAAGSLQTETFAHCDRSTTVITGPLAGARGCAAGGAVRAGLSVSDAGGGWDKALFIAAPRFGSNRGYAVGEDTSAAEALALDFAGGSRAVGFDVYQNFGGGAQLGRAADFSVHVFSGAVLDGAFPVRVPSGGRGFFGVIGEAAITRVTIDNPLAYDMVGDVAFSLPRKTWGALAFVAPFPTAEPAAFALLGFGAAGLALARRR